MNIKLNILIEGNDLIKYYINVNNVKIIKNNSKQFRYAYNKEIIVIATRAIIKVHKNNGVKVI